MFAPGMEERFNEFVRVFSEKFTLLEEKIDAVRLGDRHTVTFDTESARNEPVASHGLSEESGHVASSSAPQGATWSSKTDLQGEFSALKDSLQRIQLPGELKLNDSRQGIRRSDQQVLNVISKCGRYNETLMKLLTTIEPGSTISQDTLDQLFVIAQAQGRWLQDEYAALVVNSQFDPNTAKLFKALQRNTSGLNPASLETLRSAASISAVSRPAPAPVGRESGGSFQHRGSGRYRGGYNRQDVFRSFTRRPFPGRPGSGPTTGSGRFDNTADEDH